MRMGSFRRVGEGTPPRRADQFLALPNRPNGGGDSRQMDDFMVFWEGKMEQLRLKECSTNHSPITGNLYMYRTLCDFADAAGLFRKKQTTFVAVALNLVIFLQVIGPLCLLIWAVKGIEFGNNGHYLGGSRFFAFQFGSEEIGLPHVFMRVLGLGFLILFIMNGMYVLEDDKVETQKVTEMVILFQSVARQKPMMMNERGGMRQRMSNMMLGSRAEPPVEGAVSLPQTEWLWIGAIINSLCLVLCSLSMVFMFIVEESPKDLVLDAFGLAFLYNLDDIGGDLAFLDEKWDEDFMGQIYGELEDAETSGGNLLEGASQKRQATFTPDTIYDIARVVMYFLVIFLPFLYMFLEMHPKPKGEIFPPARPSPPAGFV